MKAREQRTQILLRCMRVLYPLCYKRAPMLKTTPHDLINELAVIMLTVLIRYKKRPLVERQKLAYVSGRNWLGCLVRTALTNVRRGAKAEHVSLDSQIVKPYSASNIHTFETWFDTTRLVIMQVGAKKAPYLLEASLLDWRAQLTEEHYRVMRGLSTTSPLCVIQWIQTFRRTLLAQLKNPTDSVVVSRHEGVWRAYNPSN